MEGSKAKPSNEDIVHFTGVMLNGILKFALTTAETKGMTRPRRMAAQGLVEALRDAVTYWDDLFVKYRQTDDGS